VKLRQKMSAGNRRGCVRALEASFLWARLLVKKWTRSAVAQRGRGPCPAGLELALGQGERVGSRSSGSRFAESPGFHSSGASAPGSGRHPTRSTESARWRHNPSRPRRARATPAAPRNRHRVANNRRTPGPVADSCRFLRKQRDGGAPGASICASPVVRYRDRRLCCTQNSRGTRKERGRDEHRATLF
jgi:hypothetical protein